MVLARGADLNPNESLLHGLNLSHPLAAAAGRGHLEIVNALLAAGFNPNPGSTVWNQEGHAIAVAAANNHSDIVRALLLSGADPNPRPCLYGPASHPLATAASQGHAEIVRLLLKAGANPNTSEVQGALCAALFRGYLAVVRELANAGTATERCLHWHEFHGIRPASGDWSNIWLLVQLEQWLLDAAMMSHMFFHPCALVQRMWPYVPAISLAGPPTVGSALALAGRQGHEHIVDPLAAAGVSAPTDRTIIQMLAMLAACRVGR